MGEVKFILKLMKDKLKMKESKVGIEEYFEDEENLMSDFFYCFFEWKILERVVVN